MVSSLEAGSRFTEAEDAGGEAGAGYGRHGDGGNFSSYMVV